MKEKIKEFLKSGLKKELPDIRPGDTVNVVQKIQEGDKERMVSFKGTVIARKHGKEVGATITIRKVISGIGVERIFPIYSPTIKKIEILKRGKVKRAKLYYLRKAKGRKTKIKRVKLKEKVVLSDKVVARLEKTEEKNKKQKEVKE